MIITITLNPAVDISYPLANLAIDTINRVDGVSKTAGGKGLNVARVIKQLDEEVGASGFLGGSLGSFIRKQLEKEGIEDYFVSISGETRNCIAILHNGKQTEILEGGPTITKEEQEDFLKAFEDFVQKAEIITLSGSLPKGLDANFYKKLIAIIHKHGKRSLVDTGGSLLKEILSDESKPYLIKPNEEEIADLLAYESIDQLNIEQALQDPLFDGVTWTVVTLGGDGAVVKHHDKIYRVRIPSVEVVSPVGSGDAVIAGFATGMKRELKQQQLIKFAVAMGVLNAMEEKTGSIDPEKIEDIVKEIRIEHI